MTLKIYSFNPITKIFIQFNHNGFSINPLIIFFFNLCMVLYQAWTIKNIWACLLQPQKIKLHNSFENKHITNNNCWWCLSHLERGKSYGNRLSNNASCKISLFNVYGRQWQLNDTMIPSAFSLAKKLNLLQKCWKVWPCHGSVMCKVLFGDNHSEVWSQLLLLLTCALNSW